MKIKKDIGLMEHLLKPSTKSYRDYATEVIKKRVTEDGWYFSLKFGSELERDFSFEFVSRYRRESKEIHSDPETGLLYLSRDDWERYGGEEAEWVIITVNLAGPKAKQKNR